MCFAYDAVVYQSMFDWLAQRSGENPLTPEQKEIFWTRFNSYCVPVTERTLSVRAARNLVRQIKTVLKSRTVAAMRHRGYVFHGILDQSGSGKALLYNVIHSDTGMIKCGKVYLNNEGNERSISIERSASELIHADGIVPAIVHYEACLSFRHETVPEKSIVVFVMPLFQLTLSDVIEAYFDSPLPMNMYCRLVRCLFSAASRLYDVGRAHCDIKPENIMILNGEFTVIDLGAVTVFGNAVEEFTVGYGMEESRMSVTGKFDLYCIACTLARCLGYEVAPKNTTSLLKGWMESMSAEIAELAAPICISLASANGRIAMQEVTSWLEQNNM